MDFGLFQVFLGISSLVVWPSVGVLAKMRNYGQKLAKKGL